MGLFFFLEIPFILSLFTVLVLQFMLQFVCMKWIMSIDLDPVPGFENPGVIGKFGLGVQNEAGQRLIEFSYLRYYNLPAEKAAE